MRYGRVIEGKTVRLRDIRDDDAEVTFKMRSDPEKSRYIHGATGTVEDQLSFIRKQEGKPGDWLFAIEDTTGKIIGMKGVYEYDPETGHVETGRFMCFGSQLQSVEALMLSFDFCFDVLGVDEIVMSALSENTNMRGMQDRFGVRVTHSIYQPEFGCESVYSVLTKEAYAKTRPGISSLIDRFAERMGGIR